MKRPIPILLLCLIFTLSVLHGYGQSDAEKVFCKECPETIQISQISRDQKLDSIQYQQFDKKDNSWKTVLKTTFEYNKKQISRESNTYRQDHFDNYRNGGITGKSQHIYTYNKAGQLLTDEFQYEEHAEAQVSETDDNPTTGILSPIPVKPQIKGRYKEDEYGRWYVVEEHQKNGAYKCSYTYTPNGQLHSVLYQVKDGSDLKDYSKISYVYDPKNKLISESLSFTDSNKVWQLYQEERHTYDKKGIKISSIRKRMYDPTGGEKYYLSIPVQSHYTYNPAGILVKEVHQQSIDSTWEDYEQIMTTINAKPNTTEILKQSADGGVWYNALLVKNQTDAKGNIINSVTLEPQFEEWVTLSLQSYTYDKKNNRLSYLEDPMKEPEFSDSFRCQYFYSRK